MNRSTAFTPRRLLVALLAVAALAALPAGASAHGSVYTSNARTAPGSFTYTTPGGTGLTTVTRYVFANHGFVGVFTESNGVTTNGVVDYKIMPSAYRSALRADSVNGGDAVFLSEASTGLQAHATCSGVALLSSLANVKAWQGADPFYAYVPFQPQAAGFEDDPALWTAVVKTATGVDLATITDTSTAPGSPLANACTGIGGTLVPPDTTQTAGSAFASGNIAEAVATATQPLNTQITGLTSDKSTLQGTVGTLTGAKTTLEADRASLLSQLAASNKAKNKALSEIKSLKKQVAKLKKKLKG